MCHTEDPTAKEVLDNNLHQIEEALGDDNRYFANQYYQEHFSRNTENDTEVILYYINNGGAKGHRQRMEERLSAEQPPTGE
ncbi:MAG: hypothetical protein WCV50_04765 [Patescibacteria group bacterium]|jgi:hypothetical protein